ncbi:hypothetical protein FHS92_002388 [Sphingobium subterraneum]|uniref:Uncharacterized protein n=1 Tax=Sphingobium subterraneum TaxID=627688 RepID=A0A841J133_9SPHN|nr:hypothetical protein [Sphingobium subterraneum]
MALAALFPRNGQELYPEHPADGWLAFAFSVGCGIFCFITVSRKAPSNFRNGCSALLWAFLATFIFLPTTGIALERIHQIIEFTGVKITKSEREFPIYRGDIHRSKGIHYEILLKDYPVLLEIDPSDYLTAFANVDQVYPTGFCIRANVQTTAHAARIMTPDWPFPAGSLVRCSRVSSNRNQQQPK